MRYRVWISLSLLCAALGSSIVPACADDQLSLDALRAKMKAAEGTPLTNYVETRTVTGDDGASTVTIYRRGDDERRVREGSGYRAESGVVGGEHWFQNANGLTVIDTPPDADKDAPAPTVTLSRVTQPVDAYCITTDDHRGGVRKEYVDPATFMIVRVDERDAAGSATTTYTKFSTVGNHTFASEWTYDDRQRSKVTHVIDSIDIARPVTAADVAEPPTERMLLEFPSAAPVSVPATFVANQIFVHVSIAGHPADLLLDTGSSGIVLDRTFARQIGLSLTDRTINAENAKAAEEFSVRLPSIEIGAARMHDIAAAAMDFSNFDASGKEHAVGLLGFDFLATAAVTIDYEHRTVTLTPHDAFQPPKAPDTMEIDVKLGTETPQVPVTIEGHRSDRFTVDTGANGGFVLFASFERRFPGIGIRMAGTQMSGAGGETPVTIVQLRSLKFGYINVRDMYGLLTTSATSYADFGDGLIGTDFLQLFTLDLDYPDGAIFLTPNARGKSMGLR